MREELYSELVQKETFLVELQVNHQHNPENVLLVFSASSIGPVAELSAPAELDFRFETLIGDQWSF